ncbi:MAG: lytic transglycosylase domain-containing protein [Bacteroidales bacterium]|nr:lytic transglycosylase domain-containing protein [Bacteroidales bacterium]
MSWKSLAIIAISAICLLEGFLLYENQREKKNDSEYTLAYQQNNRIYAVLSPSTLDFAGEPLPMNLYYVREGVDRELLVNSYWQSNTLLLLKKANRYFRIMEPILKQYNIPDDFKYLALIESGLSNVVSPAGASGIWQFMPETAKRYGLEITEEVDERYNLEKSTIAACKLLANSYSIFGNWTLSAAAYNAGEGRIQKSLSEQKISNYYDLYLNSETSRYIYRIVALKLLYEHPTEFGFFLRNKDLYPSIPTYTVSIDSSIASLVNYSNRLNINYKILKEFNPWLRKEKLTVKAGKKYLLTIPKKGYDNFEMLQQQAVEAESFFNDTAVAGRLFR